MIRRPPRSTLFPTRRSSDLEHQEREQVIQYIYRKYGRLRAALTGVVISYRPRSVLRDVGKALGVDAGVVEDRKSTRLNSSHANISYAVFCLKKNITTPLTPI